MLTAEKVSFRYPHANMLFQRLSLKVEIGDFTMLLGPNGSGKSTILKLLAGYLTSCGGVVALDGRSLGTVPPRERAKRIAVVTQTRIPALPYSVWEFVMMGRHAHLATLLPPSQHDRDVVRAAMGLLGIAHLANRPCGQLSGGEFQRVSVASALAAESEYLLLDEPTSALDPEHKLALLELLQKCSVNMGILMVTHDLQSALDYAKTVFLFNRDGALLRGTPAEVLTPASIRTVYRCGSELLHGCDGSSARAIVLRPADKG
ncbi:MAG: ABC transporter ATP-binding protein [Victivallaceae bacterium]|nr:ABC transporter ATP-binding protein [Victivallaceae bacterium]